MRKSERKICFFLSVYTLYVLFFFVLLLSLKLGDVTKSKILSVFFIADILINLVFSVSICIIAYFTLQFNKPQATRTDLRTGKQVTMLLFVQSKMYLRKIFDQDTDPQHRDTDVQGDREDVIDSKS